MDEAKVTDIMIELYAKAYDASFVQAKKRFATELTSGVSAERALEIISCIKKDTLDVFLEILGAQKSVYCYVNTER